ncbi:hypothetical protein ADIMK_4012 [Marinobacterium lacunae]|uniref:Uncharacterized protein n=1 Tax=Marinobacterium lacunae TaxID=1232683 RepID=A0A081FTL0_9GAMM|nr:hypothetical protein [Marinobacterium lacunae]KEA61865.1 hypothetical protein ADIMK_4012 [Marinobacterium lacunae]MBR9884307.1 hypothetical protein [Oceanospirillales bacterium]
MTDTPDIPSQDQQINDSLALWQLIQVGDLIQVEANLLSDEGRPQLRSNRYYEVVAKSDGSNGHYGFYVQSDLTNEVIEVFAGFVMDYQRAATPPHHA